MPLLFGNGKIRNTVPKTPVFLLRLRQYNSYIFPPNRLLSLNFNPLQSLIQSLEEPLLNLTRPSRRQKHVNKDMFIGAIEVEIISREKELIRFMFGDDLEIVALEDGEMGYHSFVNSFGDDFKQLGGATLQEIDPDERH